MAVPPEKVKEIRSTVASMRLDSIAGLGFGESRTKMQREIKAGKVQSQLASCLITGLRCQSWRRLDRDPGTRRVILEEMTGVSKKGRTGVLLKRLM